MNNKKSSLKVLIIDDDDIILQSVKFILEDLDVLSVEHSCGTKGIEYYNAHHNEIDMVILDLIMPGMSGLECYHKLREINPDVYVIISSGYSIDDQKEDLNKLGIKGFLCKPFSVEDIADIITNKRKIPG